MSASREDSVADSLQRGRERISSVAESVERRFKTGRRVLSFAEYLDLFSTDPVRYARDASRYLRDVFDHYGKSTARHPWGEFTRFNLFDLPWEGAAAGLRSLGIDPGSLHLHFANRLDAGRCVAPAGAGRPPE